MTGDKCRKDGDCGGKRDCRDILSAEQKGCAEESQECFCYPNRGVKMCLNSWDCEAQEICARRPAQENVLASEKNSNGGIQGLCISESAAHRNGLHASPRDPLTLEIVAFLKWTKADEYAKAAMRVGDVDQCCMSE